MAMLAETERRVYGNEAGGMEAVAANPMAETQRVLSDAHAPDEVAVRALYRELMDGWNRGSGAAFAAVFAEDGDLVGFDGTRFQGRGVIAPFHQELFDKWVKGTRLVGRVTDVRFLSADVALLHATGGTVKRGRSVPAPEQDSIQTLVATRQGGEWRLAAFQNTRLRPIGPGFASILAWLVSDLLWKVLCRKTSAA